MADRFYYGQTDYIVQLNYLSTAFDSAMSAVQGTAGAAANSATAAASSATAAAAARDAAIAAWQASTAPAEQLAALSKSFHSGAIVDVFLYDTSRDSDGGAWRKRCAHTSWENEALVPGKWLGAAASHAAAWAIAGAAAGDYYQASGTGVFYQLDTPQTGGFAVYRGNARQFPATALIVVEASRVVIYDATKPDLPMWASFVGAASNLFYGPSNLTSVTACNGKLMVGDTGAVFPGLYVLDFLSDIAYKYGTGGRSRYKGTLAQRNAAADFIYNQSYGAIVHATVYDVAAAVLPDAPLDPATDLPIPTIAVATAGGVSILKHDGTVPSWLTTVGLVRAVDISSTGTLVATGGDTVAYKNWIKNSLPTASPDNTYDFAFSNASIPSRAGNDGAYGQYTKCLRSKSHIAFGASSGSTLVPLILLKETPATYAKSMVAHIANAYNSGWMAGDARGAWLADTTVEALAASGELVTNGGFATDTNGWTPTANTTSSVVAGAMRLTLIADGFVRSTFPIPTTAGKTYSVSVTVIGRTTTSSAVVVGVSAGGTDGSLAAPVVGGAGTYTFNFTATGATSYLAIGSGSGCLAGQYIDFDNVSVKLAEPDRSVKGKGLIVNGSITKAAVAAGAQLVAYGGFNAANYLEQPYNSDLDFGPGDFHISGWVNIAATPVTNEALFWRQTPGNTGAGISIMALNTGGVSVGILGVRSAVANLAAGLHKLDAKRENGVLYLFIDGQLATSVADTTNLTNTTAVTRVGIDASGGQPAATSKLALWRVSATPASADQIAQMYRDELALFQPNAKCTIDGNSATITTLAYDDTTGLLHVGTGWGRSAFKNLLRVESSATTVGAVTAIAAAQGAHITGGATAARYVQPSMLLRDELRRREDAKRAEGRVPRPFPYVGDGTKASFTLPYGWSVHAVYRQGLIMAEGAANDYTTSFDGYRWTVTFPAAVPNNYNVCIMGVKNG
jgi:hypothetical protein